MNENTVILEDIKQELIKLNSKMAQLLTLQRAKTSILDTQILDGMALLDLPDHVRKTAMAIITLGRATAEDVAAHTGRARAVESAYLNQLCTLGYLNKERVGRKAFFFRKQSDKENPL